MDKNTLNKMLVDLIIVGEEIAKSNDWTINSPARLDGHRIIDTILAEFDRLIDIEVKYKQLRYAIDALLKREE